MNTTICQYRHLPNNTELGKGNTHETYMLVKSSIDLSNMLPPSVPILFENQDTNKSYELKSAKGSEFRINQMGEVYRDYDVMPGDEILLTKIERESSAKYLLKVEKYNRIVLFISGNGTEIGNIERLEPFKNEDGSYTLSALYETKAADVFVKFKEAKQKRKDSPITTDFYELTFNGELLPNNTYYLCLEDVNKILLIDKSQYNEVKVNDINLSSNDDVSLKKDNNYVLSEAVNDMLSALRTKPFLLLAGISGTGKSRIVKKMAFETCTEKDSLRDDLTSPGNYQLIEVKPNWHDSTEVLGYESEIGGVHYVTTPFIKFLVKAMCYPDTPFFVCMDEMNLAPVEQYFAEFLSILESRKLVDGIITSEPLVKPYVFNKKYDLCYDIFVDLGLKKVPKSVGKTENDKLGNNGTTEAFERQDIVDKLKIEGLRLPQNLIVIGTVNMDETTHQFSRKVIDRAMTIEMNIADGEEPFSDFFKNNEELQYMDKPLGKDYFLANYVQASEAMNALSKEDKDFLMTNIPLRLSELNSALNNTPFKIAYRVQNELVLYFTSLRQRNEIIAAEELLASALDGILIMKVLPRIEGDEDLLEKPLRELDKYTQGLPQSAKKVKEMSDRLERAHFTSFWP